jgi:hypothetical protein
VPSSDRLRAPARIGAGGIGRSGLIATGREYNLGRRSPRRSAEGSAQGSCWPRAPTRRQSRTADCRRIPDLQIARGLAPRPMRCYA